VKGTAVVIVLLLEKNSVFDKDFTFSFAIIGSGIYADNKSRTACATGYGEYTMRLCLCKYACDQMQSKNSAPLSSKKSIEMLTKRFGKNTGGIITVDTKGRFGIACNTRSMSTALITNKNQKHIIAFGSD
jgi:L-asparaginase / beta-aspartyl-peptidase